MKVEITEELMQLKGKEFVSYCLFDHPDKEFREKMKMLNYAVIYDLEKTEKYIRMLIDNKNLELFFFYPSFHDKEEVKNKKRIGSIPEGDLYLVK